VYSPFGKKNRLGEGFHLSASWARLDKNQKAVRIARHNSRLMSQPENASKSGIEGGVSISGHVSPEILETIRTVKSLIGFFASDNLRSAFSRVSVTPKESGRVKVEVVLSEEEVLKIVEGVKTAALAAISGVCAGIVLAFAAGYMANH